VGAGGARPGAGSGARCCSQVLATLGARLRFRLAADVVLASFLVSHVVPFGSAAGPAVNASTLERDGIAVATTGEAIALTGLVSATALITLFGTGFAATAGRHLPQAYLTVAGIALAVVVAVLATVLFDLLSLDLMFLAFGYQPGFGPLAVAYAAANIASAVPLTPGGLGVVELTLVAITVGFGAPGPRRSWPCSATGW
jgi:uncharacterized membrane protein YbhN (UPF0104 family)